MLRRFAGSISGGFEPEYQAVLDKAISLGYGLPSQTTQQKDNDLIKGLKADGEWDNLTEFFYMLSTDGSEEFSTINWINPDLFQLTKIGSPTFTTNQGWLSGLDSGNALNTNYSGINNRQLAQFDNFSFGCYLFNSTSASGSIIEMGSRNLSITPRRLTYLFGNGFNGFINESTTSGGLDTGVFNSKGLRSFSRAAETRRAYRNGILSIEDTSTPTNFPVEKFYLLALNNEGVVSGESDRTMQFAFAGLGNVNQLDLYNRLNTRLS